MSRLIGVLGLGSIGMRHARNLAGLGCNVIGYDPAPAARNGFAESGGTVAESRGNLLGTVDAVVIASPSHLHMGDLSDALTAGRHVFVEKPIAHTDVGLPQLLGDAARRGLVVFAGLNLRFHPAIQRARDLLAGGILGRPLWSRLIAASYLPAWRPTQDYRANYAATPGSGGAIFDFIHEFDLAHYLLGPARALAGTARRSGTLEIPTEDIADAILCHEGGVHSTIHVDYVSRPRRRLVEIGATNGALTIDLEHWMLKAVGADGAPVAEESWSPDPNGMYVAEMTAFLSSLDGAPPACSGSEALAVLRTVLDVRRLAGLP